MKLTIILTLASISAFSQIDSTKIKHRADIIKAHLDGQKYIADKIRNQHKIDSVKLAQKKLVKQPAKKDNE